MNTDSYILLVASSPQIQFLLGFNRPSLRGMFSFLSFKKDKIKKGTGVFAS